METNKTLLLFGMAVVLLAGCGKQEEAAPEAPPASQDALVYEEEDDSFYMGIGRSRDDKFICISVESTVSCRVL